MADRSGGDGLLILKLVVTVPKLYGKVLEDRPDSILALTKGKRQYYHLFFELVVERVNFLLERTVDVVNRDRLTERV